MQDESRDIPINELIEPRLLLRLVDRDSVEYLELRDSIADKGFLNSLCVRPAVREPGKYEIVDGMYRFTSAKDLRFERLPCLIKHGLTDDDVLALQIQANAVRPETKPTDFARQLKKIMSHRRDMTMAALAHMVHKTPAWVSAMLGLLKLGRDLQKAVDRGEIPLGNAYMLAKIPHLYRKQFADQAKVLSGKEFRAITAAFIKQFTEAVRQGKLEALHAGEFSPVAYLRGLKEIQAEYEGRESGALATTAANCKTPVDGWYCALQWAMHLDPQSIAHQRKAAVHRAHVDLHDQLEVKDDELEDS